MKKAYLEIYEYDCDGDYDDKRRGTILCEAGTYAGFSSSAASAFIDHGNIRVIVYVSHYNDTGVTEKEMERIAQRFHDGDFRTIRIILRRECPDGDEMTIM